MSTVKAFKEYVESVQEEYTRLANTDEFKQLYQEVLDACKENHVEPNKHTIENNILQFCTNTDELKNTMVDYDYMNDQPLSLMRKTSYINEKNEPHITIRHYRLFLTWKSSKKNKSTKSNKIVSGIYGLYKNNTLIYIGKSVDIKKRIKQHEEKKSFDYYKIIEKCKKEELNDIEKKYLMVFKPSENIRKHDSKDKEKCCV